MYNYKTSGFNNFLTRAKPRQVFDNVNLADFMQAGSVPFSSLYLESGQIAGKVNASEITSAMLADAAVTTAKLANLAVNNDKLAALAVDAAKLAGSAVTAEKIANLAVGSAAIAALAVGTGHIANLAVLEGKIGALAVTNAKIGSGAITEVKIGSAAVTNAKIGSLAVTNAKIGSAAITNAKINDLSADKINAGTLTGREVQSNSDSYRIILQPSQRRMACYDGGTHKGSVYTDSDGDFKIRGLDDLVLEKPSGGELRIRNGDGGQLHHTFESDGDQKPWSNNTRKVGTNSVAYAEMNAYSFVDHCLWLDEEDDLKILKACQPKKDKYNEIIRDKDGNPFLDHHSLPNWLNTERNIRKEINEKRPPLEKRLKHYSDKLKIKDNEAFRNKKKEMERMLSELNLSEDEIKERTGRNLSHFVDLIAGAVRQLSDKVDKLENK